MNQFLRAFEKVSGKEAVRPDIAGLMGAFGAALISKENYKENDVSSILSESDLKEFKVSNEFNHCGLCSNNCLLTINKFSDGRKFISGNRCERCEGASKNKKKAANLFDYKYKRIFGYKPLTIEEAKRGEVGIPRVLNMYENYPFWHVFFTELGLGWYYLQILQRKFIMKVLKLYHLNLFVILQKLLMDI